MKEYLGRAIRKITKKFQFFSLKSAGFEFFMQRRVYMIVLKYKIWADYDEGFDFQAVLTFFGHFSGGHFLLPFHLQHQHTVYMFLSPE